MPEANAFGMSSCTTSYMDTIQTRCMANVHTLRAATSPRSCSTSASRSLSCRRSCRTSASCAEALLGAAGCDSAAASAAAAVACACSANAPDSQTSIRAHFSMGSQAHSMDVCQSAASMKLVRSVKHLHRADLSRPLHRRSLWGGGHTDLQMRHKGQQVSVIRSAHARSSFSTSITPSLSESARWLFQAVTGQRVTCQW